jgi:hypothetical protein
MVRNEMRTKRLMKAIMEGKKKRMVLRTMIPTAMMMFVVLETSNQSMSFCGSKRRCLPFASS